MRPHENKISIVDISKQGVCENLFQIVGPIIRMNDRVVRINDQCCGRQLNYYIIQLPIAKGQKPSKRVDPKAGKGFDKCNQICS
jgi:hypothetical protein